jgi:hypothetical protein
MFDSAANRMFRLFAWAGIEAFPRAKAKDGGRLRWPYVKIRMSRATMEVL